MQRTHGLIRRDLEHDPRGGQRTDGDDSPVITWAPEDTGHALEALTWTLGDTYEFGIDGRGRWVALRRDGQGALAGDGPDTLLAAIRADVAPAAGDAAAQPGEA
jgi:hypothetical protein